ncbi:hypothetical protein ACJIZ3_023490 [Penstemon smallii]|uniref:FYVE-type domain-containing protein n=1 Tax=Penstemon smallii TaxID=265156 RepID=A0ABD3TP73_9LAMI
MHQPTDTTGSSYYHHQPYYHNPSADPPPSVTAAVPYAPNPYASAPPVSDYSNSLPSFPPNTDHVPNFNSQYNFPYPYQHNQPPVNYDYSIPTNPNPNPIPNPQFTSNLYGASSLPYHTNYGGDQEPFNEGVYKYNGGGGGSGKGGRTDSGSGFGKGGRSESGSGGGVMFDDYGRPINVSGGKEQSGFGNSSINKIVKAAPKVEDESQDVSGVQKYRVKLLSEGFGQTDMDVLCQIGLDGIWFLDPATSRTLKIYPLETLTRWEVLDSYIFAFWAKTSVDPEPRRVRLKSSSYTTSNILDTVTAASIQSKEIGTSSNPADLVKVSDQSADKRRGFDWKNLIKPVNEEKDHWVPDEVVTKCTACAADFSAFNRKHHCRNCGDIFCDKCTQGRIALTADEDAQLVRVCDRCMVCRIIYLLFKTLSLKLCPMYFLPWVPYLIEMITSINSLYNYVWFYALMQSSKLIYLLCSFPFLFGRLNQIISVFCQYRCHFSTLRHCPLSLIEVKSFLYSNLMPIPCIHFDQAQLVIIQLLFCLFKNKFQLRKYWSPIFWNCYLQLRTIHSAVLFCHWWKQKVTDFGENLIGHSIQTDSILMNENPRISSVHLMLLQESTTDCTVAVVGCRFAENHDQYSRNLNCISFNGYILNSEYK